MASQSFCSVTFHQHQPHRRVCHRALARRPLGALLRRIWINSFAHCWSWPPPSSPSPRIAPSKASSFTTLSSLAQTLTPFPIHGASTSSPTTLPYRTLKSSTPSTPCAPCSQVSCSACRHRLQHRESLESLTLFPRFAGRHFIARIQGQPLHTGLFIDSTYEIGSEPVVLHPRALHALAAHVRERLCRRALGLGVLLQHVRVWLQHRVPFHRVG